MAPFSVRGAANTMTFATTSLASFVDRGSLQRMSPLACSRSLAGRVIANVRDSVLAHDLRVVVRSEMATTTDGDNVQPVGTIVAHMVVPVEGGANEADRTIKFTSAFQVPELDRVPDRPSRLQFPVRPSNLFRSLRALTNRRTAPFCRRVSLASGHTGRCLAHRRAARLAHGTNASGRPRVSTELDKLLPSARVTAVRATADHKACRDHLCAPAHVFGGHLGHVRQYTIQTGLTQS